jgi:hypothetical protein
MSVDNARNDLQDIDRFPPEVVLPHEPHEATIFMIEPLLQATPSPPCSEWRPPQVPQDSPCNIHSDPSSS